MISPLPQVGIVNANTRGVSASFGPLVMRGAMSGMSRPLFLAKVTQSMVEGRIKDVETPLLTSGVIQPMGQREVEIKPEGQRAWQWQTVHVTTDCVLRTNDVIVYKSARYTIMSDGAYDDFGFVKYEAVKAYGAAR